MLSDTEFKGEGPAPSGSRPPLGKAVVAAVSVAEVVVVAVTEALVAAVSVVAVLTSQAIVMALSVAEAMVSVREAVVVVVMA